MSTSLSSLSATYKKHDYKFHRAIECAVIDAFQTWGLAPIGLYNTLRLFKFADGQCGINKDKTPVIVDPDLFCVAFTTFRLTGKVTLNYDELRSEYERLERFWTKMEPGQA